MRFGTLQQIFFFGMLFVATFAFLYILLPFAFPLFWAFVLGILFFPVFEWFEKRLKYGWIASTVTIITILVAVLLPLTLVGSSVVTEGIHLYTQITDGSFDPAGSVETVVAKITPYTEVYGISAEFIDTKIQELTGEFGNWLANSLIGWGQLTFSIIIDIFIMLYLLFFIFTDGRKLEQKALRILPLGDEYERALFKRFTETTRAVIKGTFVMGIAQGLIGGILFALVGIPSPILWGVAMAVLSIIPGVGSGLIWVPAAIILALSGSMSEGLILFFGGAILISGIDNVLRPIIVGRSSGLPDPIILLSTLGGLVIFGISGFIVGPVIASLCLTIWEFFEKKYQNELALNK